MHGSLPYERIKPDLQLRSVLLSISQRKIVRKFPISFQNRIRDEFRFVSLIRSSFFSLSDLHELGQNSRRKGSEKARIGRLFRRYHLLRDSQSEPLSVGATRRVSGPSEAVDRRHENRIGSGRNRSDTNGTLTK